MAIISGALANAAWASPSNFLIANGKFAGFTLDVTNSVVDSSGFLDVLATHATVPRAWSGTLEGMYPTAPVSGVRGDVTLTGGNSVNVTGWELTVAANTTKVALLQEDWEASVIEGPLVITGTFSCKLDDTTAINLPTASNGAVAELELVLTDAADDSFTGDVFITGSRVGVSRTGQPEVVYSFTASGSFAGDAATVLPATFALPVRGVLTLTATTGRTYAGSASWASVNINCAAADVIRVRTDFVGNGALTVA